MHWLELLDERQRKAVAFAERYVLEFNHGASGHNDLTLIHKLASLLEHITTHGGELPVPPAREYLPLGFGKYASESLREIAIHDSGYVEWLVRNSRDAEVQAAAQRVLAEWNAKRQAPPEAPAEPAAPGELPF